MRNFFVYLVVVIGVILAGAAIYFGSILPLAKSKSYIAAERNLRQVKSVPDFVANFDRAVNFYSPVGDEETAKFLGGKILDVLSSLELPEKDSLMLAEYADKVLFTDDVRHIMMRGHVWKIMWQKFDKQEYFDRAEASFKNAHEIGPRLPTPLYALYTLYSAAGDTDNANIYKDKIEALWPKTRTMPGYFEQAN